MKNILGWLIAGVGAYYLYEKYYVGDTGTAVPIQPGTSPTQNSQNTQTSISSSQPGVISVGPNPGGVSSQVQTLINAFMQSISSSGEANNFHNLDEWNWYFSNATGTQGPAIEDLGIAVRATRMNATTYANIIGRFLSGNNSLSGLGRIVGASTYTTPSARLYGNVAGISHRGTIVPNGFELSRKQVH